jgi:hypothetical protein
MAPIQDGLISHMNKTTYAEMQKPPSEGQDVDGEEGESETGDVQESGRLKK